MNSIQDRQFLRWGILLLVLLTLAGQLAYVNKIELEGWAQLSLGLRAARGLGWAGVAVAAVLGLFVWLGGTEKVIALLKLLLGRLSALGWLNFPVMFALLLAYPVLMYGRYGIYLAQDWTRYVVFAWVLVVLTLFMVATWQKPWMEITTTAALSMAVVYHLATYLPHISNYPFGLWWSETTRYYLASTNLGPEIYGQELPWVMKDMTRYLIQAVPFLVPGTPIWIHRLWQVVLRFSTGYLTGWILARRLGLSSKMAAGVFTAWAGLFLFQGPVFYHLIVVVMLVLWLVDVRRFWKTLLVVAAVSVYAGFSRINWVPMPGLIAAVYYFLETPVESRDLRNVARYLWRPVVWVLAGMSAGMAVNQYWVVNSGNPPEVYSSSFTSYMLWDRLFPNPSYPMGILPLILAVSVPLLIYLGMGLRNWRPRHWVRLLGLAGITAGLFTGGLLVSVKIGGGTNLHNMDVFLVVLLIIAAGLYFGKVVDDQDRPVTVRIPTLLQGVIVFMPVIFLIVQYPPQSLSLDYQAAETDVARLQEYVDLAAEQGGEVLFMSERHLLAFGLIEGVPLVHDYEKMLVMEMVMGQNQDYLDDFAGKLAGHQYALIVSDPLPARFKDPAVEPLAMENNIVYQNLAPAILCAYQQEARLLDGRLVLFVPKAEITCPSR